MTKEEVYEKWGANHGAIIKSGEPGKLNELSADLQAMLKTVTVEEFFDYVESKHEEEDNESTD